jgi:hypothetical protein
MPVSGHGTVTLLTPTIQGSKESLVCIGTSWNTDQTALTITYTMGSTTVHVTVQISTKSTGVQAQLDADQPVIASVNLGDWTSNLSAQAIAVPYYTGEVWYAESLSVYVNSWWNWHSTNASMLSGTSAQYHPKTDGTLNELHEQMEVAVSANVDDVLPAPGNAASPSMSTIAGRTVVDIWDPGFSFIQQGLSDLGDYGISDCVGIIHDWQHEGYDNALPLHYSANSDFGGGSGMQALIAQGNANGCLMAVHENYVDYYPNYPNFNGAAVALQGDGSEMPSWLNPSTGIQSFSTKPSWMVANAQTQSPTIHRAYGTTAAYLDVHSAAPISSHGDMDSNSPGAASLTSWMEANKSLWAYERKTHNGPVFGEGLDHWYYSGLLDGVEAQLGAGSVPANSGETLPLFVDFDLLRIHPLQVNHGMGYYERWTKAKTSSMTTAQIDAYRMQEIAFGHAPFLGASAWSDVQRAFVETNLVSPVATSYGTAQASSIQYQVNGTWANSSLAAQSDQFSQVQVTYSNGLALVANSNATPLTWNGLTLPQYGWAAKSANILAYTAQCGNTICDYAQTPTSLFANARNQSDAEIGSGYAKPSVASVKQGDGNSFAITYNWNVYRPIGSLVKYKAFVHFVNDSQVSSNSDGIVFQGDFQPSPASSQWQTGQTIATGPVSVTIPSSVPDGTYSIRVGLYDPATGSRIRLSGNKDGSNRYIIGHLTITGGRTQIGFTASSSSAPQLNARDTLVNFDAVQTDGMVSIKLENGYWVLRPYPRSRNFTVLLKAADFPTPAIVQTSGTTSSTVVPAARGTYWQLPLNGSAAYSWQRSPIKDR